jgi:hypothetical protein
LHVGEACVDRAGKYGEIRSSKFFGINNFDYRIGRYWLVKVFEIKGVLRNSINNTRTRDQKATL